jgi:hypothetical protein
VTISDIVSFMVPQRRLDKNPGETGYDVRWDVSPGPGGLGKVVNITDVVELTTFSPPMFLGNRAFLGPVCSG